VVQKGEYASTNIDSQRAARSAGRYTGSNRSVDEPPGYEIIVLKESVDLEARSRRDFSRIRNADRRLRERVGQAAQDVARSTTLFQERPELGKPDVFVNVYAQFVDIRSSLNGSQVHHLPIEGRRTEMARYAEELRVGFEKIGAELHLPLVTGPSPIGGSGPIYVGNAPLGYRAVLRTPE
jgi:hypothetical protein